MYTMEEIEERMQAISAEMKAGADRLQEIQAAGAELRDQLLAARGRLAELENFRQLILAKEAEGEKKAPPKKKTPAKGKKS